MGTRQPQFSIERNCYVVPLSQGKIAMIDERDAYRVAKHTWCAAKHKNGRWYARTQTKRKRVYLHRFIMEVVEMIDHKNHDGLDCRRNNLRPATFNQNNANSRKRAGTSSRFKGVYRNRNKWQAELCANNVRRRLGSFHSEDEAARAYDAEARIAFGEYAHTNFPPLEAA